MDLSFYEYKIGEDFLNYEFNSEGPRGNIPKRVIFTPVRASGVFYYNIGFGDWNKKENRIDDSAISNNEDVDRVFATIALTIIEFTNHYPQALVYFEGSTSSRTRLYQMKINKFWKEID